MEEYNLKTKVVGVDISTESTTYAIVDIRGNILAEDSFETSDYPDVNNFVTALSEKIVMLVEANGGYETIRSIGVSSPSASSVTGCIRMRPISLGRVWCLWLLCSETVWDWLSDWLTMRIFLHWANIPLAAPMVCRTSLLSALA